ncbi:ACP S-malonyltransferase [Aurantimicrobium sp. MWH-Uga1]|uniref:ACP S-malonyltransferase n=1 Tax=Aurantimicrobium sp. MWH-Uga1 TaxID=2079575 RepID=UPI000DED9C93|nr:ACP S-malonyltransferase [Aurantimicrobium sp. MWH-Uga1]AXE54626.1 Malonyl CoA-acyl carrier protein transacylase [Aurantimicrobium sp. MWH-Uga1]
MIVVVCPGQGSQTPGFLEPWINDPQAKALLETLSDAADVDLVKHGTVSDADTIRDTSIAQPLIVAAGILTLDALSESDHLAKTSGIAGHSVGEFTAAAGAGVLDATDAVRLVGIRGRAMADAAALIPTGMSAVIGGEESEILAKLDQLGLFPANYNGGGQLVVAGELSALATLAEEPPAGTRVIPLQVAGAFHTSYMLDAVETLREAATEVNTNDPIKKLWTNKDGSVVTKGDTFRDLLVGQVSSPVRWDKCMDSFAAAGVSGIIEIAPAGALVGLAKRALKGVPTVAIKTPEDLVAARELIDSVA